MPEQMPFVGTSEIARVEPDNSEARDFDWEQTRENLLQQLERSNDPTRTLEYLLNFPEQHMDTEYWDEYLGWVYEQSDQFLELAERGIPEVADRVMMLLAATHTFMNEREDLFPECAYDIKTPGLRKKVVQFFVSHKELFSTEEDAAPFRLGLRLPALSRMMWLCENENQNIAAMAHRMAMPVLKKGITEGDRSVEKSLHHMDGMDVFTIFEGCVWPEEREEVAEALAKKSGVTLDLRQNRLQDKSEKERQTAHENHLASWVWSVLALEAHAEGAVKELQQRFGIVNFHHFPLQMLQQQFDLRDSDVPYGIIIAAQHDHNDAFNDIWDESMLKSFATQLTQLDTHVRVLEVDAPRALAKRLLEMDRKYGLQHKMSFGLVRAHGNSEGVKLGESDNQEVMVESLQQLKPENLSRFFVEQPPVIFDSCHTGAAGGMAEAFAKLTGAMTQGPEGVTKGIKDIEVSKEGDRLQFALTLADDIPLRSYGA